MIDDNGTLYIFIIKHWQKTQGPINLTVTQLHWANLLQSIQKWRETVDENIT